MNSTHSPNDSRKSGHLVDMSSWNFRDVENIDEVRFSSGDAITLMTSLFLTVGML